jgi:hypothetical protein
MKISRTFIVGRRHATMHLDSSGAFSVEWSTRPDRLTSQELTQYLHARNELIGAMALELAASGKVTEPYLHSMWDEKEFSS